MDMRLTCQKMWHDNLKIELNLAKKVQNWKMEFDITKHSVIFPYIWKYFERKETVYLDVQG